MINKDGTITSWSKSSSRRGGILGLLLFALYTNDLPSVLWDVSYMIYADDAQVYGHFKPSEAVFDGVTLNGFEPDGFWVTSNLTIRRFNKRRRAHFGHFWALRDVRYHVVDVVEEV